MKPKYLGDGVYAEHEGETIILKTGSHIQPTNTIYLEPDILKALRLFMLQVNTEIAETDKKKANDLKAYYQDYYRQNGREVTIRRLCVDFSFGELSAIKYLNENLKA